MTLGRPPGALNKRAAGFLNAVYEENFDAAKEIISIYREAKKTYENYAVIYEAISDAKEEQARQRGYSAVPPEDKADKYLKIALDAAERIASYCYPKLKSIEHSNRPNPLDGMTPTEKLEAMKQAVLMLEAEVKKNG